MGPKDVIRKTLEMSDYILKSYVKDLSDAELRLIPVEGMHPIALQLGHLISAEKRLLDMVKPDAAPSLPDGFKEAHDIKVCVDDSELDDNRDGKLPSFAPTVGVVLNMVGVHALSHVGQFVAVRRLLKKPIAF
jgi:hypothetical protein